MPFYRFSASSTADDNGYSVIAPYVGTGRWLLLREDVGVSSIVALKAVPEAARSPGMALYVRATNQWYVADAAAPAGGTDVAPDTGTGRWVLVTAPIEVVPPYRKVFELKSSIGHAVNIDFSLLQVQEFTYKSAIGQAMAISYNFIPTPTYPHTAAIGHAVNIGYSLIATTNYPYQTAIGHAVSMSYNLSSATPTWVNMTQADWLNLSLTDWLNLTI